MVDHFSQSMGDVGVQPCLGFREMVADSYSCSTYIVRCMEAVGQMYTTQMETTTGQETGAAYKARQK